MGIFQKSVLDKYFKEIDKNIIQNSYEKFKTVFCNAENIKNIEASKEEQYQEGFLRELFVDCLGYTINPNPSFNLTTEFKNISDSRKADGAIIKEDKPVGIIELKGTGTFDLKTVEKQAFEYRYAHPTCKYIITSNFKELRFYIDTYESYEEFTLFNMEYKDFERLYISLSKESIFNDKPLKMKTDSKLKEEDISDKLYKDYHNFKMNIYNSMVKNNPAINKVELLKKSQKLLDRILFIFFAEDRGLLPPNTISKIITENKEQADIGREEPLYNTYKIYFTHIDKGNDKLDISEYNGGLFAPDPLLDNLIIDDVVLKNDALKLSTYNFSTEIDVNILGHIFENSLNDIDELHAEVTGAEFDKSKTKRKKDGVFYTPNIITKYIINNTLGVLCIDRKRKLNLVDINLDTEKEYKRLTKDKQALLDNLHKYREFLSSLKILDPACGSGAFLNQALEFLIGEHKFIDLYRRPLEGDYLGFYDVRSSILENNLYGVDINEESVELARLSLWLRTAERGRKLNNLSGNIKCGNSIIDDESVAGELAFKWDEEFPEIMANGGFDVVIGNPPYGADLVPIEHLDFIINKYKSHEGKSDYFKYFIELSLSLSKCKIGMITPNTWLTLDSFGKIRQIVLENSSLTNLIDTKIVFENLWVNTAIFILDKNKEIDLVNVQLLSKELNTEERIIELANCEGLKSYVIDNDIFRKNNNYQIDYLVNDSFRNLKKKIFSDTISLKEIFSITTGVQVYHNSIHDKDTIKNRKFHSSKKLNNGYLKIYNGTDVERYLTNDPSEYLDLGQQVYRRPNDDFIKSSKILVQEILGRGFYKIKSSLVDENSIWANTAFGIIKISNEYSLEFLLTLLNSYLFTWYMLIFSDKAYSTGDFSRIPQTTLRNLPIKITSKNAQVTFENKTNERFDLNKQFNEKKFEFIEWLKTEFSISEISNKLDSFYELDFDGMKAELKKKMPKGKDLGPKEIGLLKKHYEEYKPKLLAVKNNIDKTDSEIDKLVYELYGLTDEEIRIVEGR